jgi:hypothetical protein
MSQQPTSSPISPLRRRDMAMRGLREETQRDYIRFVRSFAAFLGQARLLRWKPRGRTCSRKRRITSWVSSVMTCWRSGPLRG